jgi:beta-phosphoglucomutase family hydrolase
MRFQGALFDLDGTLVDNMAFHIEAWLAFAGALGLPTTKETFEHKYSGMLNAEIFPSLLGRTLSVEELEHYAEQKESTYRTLYAPHLRPAPGLIAFLEELARAGLPCAVATAGPPKNRAFVLDGLDIRRFFRSVVGAEHVKRGKPAPDIFVQAAQSLALDPKTCVVFEDALHGVTAGCAAGCAVVAVTTLMSEEALRAAGATWVVRDFGALPRDLEEALGIA